jgi:hypothetical protein
MEARLVSFHARMQSNLIAVVLRLAGVCRHRQRPIISRRCHTSRVPHPMVRHRSNSSRPCRRSSNNRHRTRVTTDSNLIHKDLPTRLSRRMRPLRRMAHSLARHNSRYHLTVASPSHRLMPGRHQTTQPTRQADNTRATRTITTEMFPRLL